MKMLVWLGGILFSLVTVIYVIAFTPFGNGLVAPAIENKIKEQTKLPSKLDTFSLSINNFKIVLHLDQKNIIYIKGSYSLFSQDFDVDYRVVLDDLKTLKPLTTTDLRGKFHTNGKVKGDMDFIKIDGISDVAKSDTTYHVELTKFNPTSIIAKVKTLKLNTLLYILNQSAYAQADVDLDINFRDITPHAMDGDIALKTKKGKLDTRLMKRDFNVTIPKTLFNMNLNAKLKGDDIDYIYAFNSNLAKISSSGNVIPKPLKTDIKYSVDIKQLALLKPLSGVDIKGDVKLEGTLKGIKDNLINKLHMDGKLDNKHLTKVYKFKSLMPKFNYDLNMQNNIKTKQIDTSLKLETSLVNLVVDKAIFKLSDGSLVSDYVVGVPSLDKLYFVTQRHMRGGIVANGEIKKAKDLDFTAHSKIAGGKLDAKLHNDDFYADLKSMQTLDILNILIYPEIFKSNLDAKVKYNLASNKGRFDGYLVNGIFMKNQAFTLIKQYAKIDMCVEKFKGDVGADIDKENILASLDLRSNTSSIKTKKTYLNSKTKKIKSKIDIVANHNPITLKLSGAVNSPKIEVDASELIKKEATKAIQKEVEKKLDKDVGGFLKGLF